MSKNTLKTTLLVIVTFLNFNQVNAQNAFDKNVFFSNLNGFSGEVALSFKLGYYFEPYYVVNQKKVVITGYENGKYNTILNKAGINFPYTLEKVGNFEFTGEIRVQKGGTMTHGYYIEKIPITFSTSYHIGTGQMFPEFSKTTLDFLRNEGSEKSLVGKEMSGGEAAWYEYGKLDKIKITEAYFSDFKNTVEKAISDFENSEKQKNQQTEQKKDDDFWSGGKENKKTNASAQDDFWSGGTGQKKTTTAQKGDFWAGQGVKSDEIALEKKIAKETNNQYLGEKEVTTRRIKVSYRDHGTIDGDRVSVYHNSGVVSNNVTLRADDQSFSITLQEGINRISFTALNQGTVGDNTAEFKIYDDNGSLIYTNSWSIGTGFRGTLLIIKK